jgi:hypothetical protein
METKENLAATSSAYPRFVENAIAFCNELAVAVWIVNPKLPVWRLRPRLKKIGVVTLDSFGDPPVNPVNPLLIAVKHPWRAITYPFRFGAQVLWVAAIIRKIEGNGACGSLPKVAVKFQQVMHVAATPNPKTEHLSTNRIGKFEHLNPIHGSVNGLC